MTNVSSSMTMKSDNESKLVNTTSSSSSSSSSRTSSSTSNVNNNNNIYNNCNSSSNKSVTQSVSQSPSTSSLSIGRGEQTATNSDLLPSITLAPFAKIKRESDFGELTVRQHHHQSHSQSQLSSSTSPSTSTSMVTKPISSNSQVPAVGGVASNSVSAKMGSRRIFTPQFKLQVLESYRNDSDCKGNQRATARKYNIHRRQIQKWLQCESNLRSSVANISANNVKHQFHNISHQMPIVTTSTLPSSASSSIHTNNNHHAHHNHQQYKAINNRLSLDTTRHSVALTSIPTIPTSKAAQGVLTAAAVAAANIGDVGAVVPLSSSSPASTSYLSTTVKSLHAPTSPILHPQILTKSTVSPSALQCTKGGPVVIGGSSIPPPPQSMLHTPYHLHDSVGIHTPPALLTSVPVPVSIITPHPHTHLHVANLKSHYHHLHMESQQQHHHHHLHHHHHHPYNQIAQPPPLPPPTAATAAAASSQQSSERRPFMPSASLPVLPTSSSSSSSSSSSTASSPPAPMPAVALSCTDTSATTPAVALSRVQAEENRTDELRDYQTSTTALLEENRYMNENEYVHSRTQLHSAFEGFPYYMPLHMHPAAAAAAAAMIAPIDLSLGTKRLGYALSFSENNNECKRERSADNTSSTTYETAEAVTPKRESSSPKENERDDDDDNEESHLNVVDSDFSESSSVVDLTLRKRKVVMPTATDPETVSAEKQTKLSSEEPDEKETEKPQEPAKTFKLFKPYLLDEDENKSTDDDKESESKICKQKEPIIWSHHTACLSPPISHDSRQCSSRGSNFQSPPADATYPFPAGSPNFQPNNATLTSASFRCPKGSPVSGYESSSSIYSDSASSTGGDHHYTNATPATYSFDLKVHNIHGDLPAKHLISTATNRPFIGDGCIPLPPGDDINHVQRWLDQESGIRRSIALYV